VIVLAAVVLLQYARVIVIDRQIDGLDIQQLMSVAVTYALLLGKICKFWQQELSDHYLRFDASTDSVLR